MLLRRQTDLEQHRGERIINYFLGWNIETSCISLTTYIITYYTFKLLTCF